MSRVLVISPHPDDEAIGCGGTLRKHVVVGAEVGVVFLTSGEKGGHGRPPEETAALREAEARQAARVLGLGALEFWHAPDGACRATRPLIDRLVRKLKKERPSLVYVPHDREMHPDHRGALRLVRAALAAVPAARRPEVLMYEVWTPLQEMDVIEDISAYIPVKLEAIRAYASQCAVMRFDDAVLGLNRYRGEMHSWPGGDYAEIFRRLP